MILESFHVRNFRRLRAVHITLEKDRTIFVGANNSGKTSAANVLALFLHDRKIERFSMHDFSAEVWANFDEVASRTAATAGASLPAISLDLWFQIAATDLHRVIDLVPKLDWAVGPVGVRLELAVKSPTQLRERYLAAHEKAKPPAGQPAPAPALWPQSVTEYLIKSFATEFEFRFLVLDRTRFDADYNPVEGYVPAALGDDGRGAATILESLIRVNFMKAQRHMAGEGTTDRGEDLSRRLSRFYDSHLVQRETDYVALRALADSETQMNVHYKSVFSDTLDRLRDLGYPGLTEAEISIRATINARDLLKGDTNVHYSLRGATDADELLLPDKYNGLGYKNLIYMVIELLDYQGRWESEPEKRALLHLILIEEPEAHLHTQLQQVFIREVQKLLHMDQGGFRTQFVVTTHSPHILYAAGFTPIRYFRREGGAGRGQHSQVLNLSAYYQATAPTRDFLQRYMELTHCDLFFADAAILVEGTVERLLVPAMVKKAAPELQACYLSLLEVGGAYGYVFRSLIDFIGLTTLVITDLDSVHPVADPVARGTVVAEDDEAVSRRRCSVQTANAVTSNQTLRQWLPGKTRVDELLLATPESKTQTKSQGIRALVRVAYQVTREVEWRGERQPLAGRTLEEDFAIENLVWCQAADRSSLRLRIKGSEALSLGQMAEKIHERVAGTSFPKTEFALALIAQNDEWRVPRYIEDGLKWLAKECVVPRKQRRTAAETVQTLVQMAAVILQPAPPEATAPISP